MYDTFDETKTYVAADLPESVKKFYVAWMKRNEEENAFKCAVSSDPVEDYLFWNGKWSDEENEKIDSYNGLVFIDYNLRSVRVDGVRYFFIEGTSNDPKDVWMMTVIGVKDNGEMEEPWAEETSNISVLTVEELKRVAKDRSCENVG